MAIGLYGPEYLQFDEGGPAAEIQIFVFLPGTKTKAQLYADESGSFTGPNPVWTDRRGELVFFTDEGNYDLWFQYPEPDGTTFSILVTAEGDGGIGQNPFVDWFTGQGPPSVVIGAGPGDMYIDTLTGLLYQLR